MTWDHDYPEWNEEGTEPDAAKKNAGWQVEERPPAGWMNWLFNRLTKAGQETREEFETHKLDYTSQLVSTRMFGKGVFLP